MPVKTESGEYVIFTDQPEGNAFGIISTVCNMLKQIHGDSAEAEIDKYKKEAESGDYENLKRVSSEATGFLLTFGESSDYNVVATALDK